MPLSARAADPVPARLSDELFWKLVVDLSEPDGSFRFDNFVSNEITYQRVIPELKRTVKPGRAFLGVGPEQNFTYIDAVEPAVAFIIDIRRQNLLQHLVYKSLFEMSTDRADFVSRLFSRSRRPGLRDTSTASQLFDAYRYYFPDARLLNGTLKAVIESLTVGHRFPLSDADRRGIETVLKVFGANGPATNY